MGWFMYGQARVRVDYSRARAKPVFRPTGGHSCRSARVAKLVWLESAVGSRSVTAVAIDPGGWEGAFFCFFDLLFHLFFFRLFLSGRHPGDSARCGHVHRQLQWSTGELRILGGRTQLNEAC